MRNRAGRGDSRLAARASSRSPFIFAMTPARRACVFATPSCKFDGSHGGRRARSAASRIDARFAIPGRADWYNRGLAAVAPHHGAASALPVSSGPAMMHAPVVPEHSSIEENT
ncbi:hypothetical protein FCJ61_36530 [Burkholderia metallica]|nr:hypothetical protein [Burkholderia metallica]